MSYNLQLSKSENIKAMFSAPKWLPVCIQFRLPYITNTASPHITSSYTYQFFEKIILYRVQGER